MTDTTTGPSDTEQPKTATLPEDVRQAIRDLRSTPGCKPATDNIISTLERYAIRAEQAEKALATARSDGWSQGLHSGAHLLTQLKAECEKQHARAEQAIRVAQKFHNAIVGHGMAGAYNRRLSEEAIADFDELTILPGEELASDYRDDLTRTEAKLEQAERERVYQVEITAGWKQIAMAAERERDALRAAVAQIIDEMRTIAMVAGQCSVEGPDNERAGMAAAESARCAVWAERLDRVGQKPEPKA